MPFSRLPDAIRRVPDAIPRISDAISLLPEHKIGVFVLVCGKRGNWKTQFCHKKHLEGAVSA